MNESKTNPIAALERALHSVAVHVSAEQRQRLAKHFELLLTWNQKINLTSILRPEDIAHRHFSESLFLTTMIAAPTGLMVDVGSGAGFPGLPLKVVWEATHSVLLEPNQKKASFLKEVIRQSNLSDVRVMTDRLEAAASGPLGHQAQLVTMRAVAIDESVLEQLTGVVAQGGRLALFLGDEDAQRITRSNLVHWEGVTTIPNSEKRVILLGHC
jgi:16S rRNA (guanine527-N7)-methyltransferase